MLNVSNAWKQMFSENLVNEALIKFVIEDYGTLYKGDIFSYEFKGHNRFLCDDYPSYNATLKLVMRSDYLNFNNFIRKSVEIYYGFVINGSDEYVKALTLFIDEIEVSDDGRVATFYLKSIFAYLTDTFSIDLYTSFSNGVLSYDTYFVDFLNDVIGSTNYTINEIENEKVRFLPSKISKGNAFQNLSFVNCYYIKLQSNGKFYLDSDVIDRYSIDKINLLRYPHITKMEYPANVIVDFLDLDNTIDVQVSSIATGGYIDVRWDNVSSSFQGDYEKDIDNISVLLDVLFVQYTIDNNVITNKTMFVKNDHCRINMIGSGVANVRNMSISGYQFNNFYGVVDDNVSIFDINILDQAQATLIQNRVETYLSTQRECEISLRFNPMIELLDVVYFANDERCILVEDMTITFNGAYKGTIKGRYDDTYIAPVVSDVSLGNTSYSFKLTNNNLFETIAIYEDELGNSYTMGAITIQQPNTTETYSQNYNAIIGTLKDKAKAKHDGNLDVNIYVRWSKGSSKSEKALLFARDVVKYAPIISNLDTANRTFDITNNNVFDVDISFSYSGGSFEYGTIQAGETIHFDMTLVPELLDSFHAYDDNLLEDDVYCFFKDENGKLSSNTIILEHQI